MIFFNLSLIVTAMIVMKSSHEMSVDSRLILAAVALLQRILLEEFDIVERVDLFYSRYHNNQVGRRTFLPTALFQTPFGLLYFHSKRGKVDQGNGPAGRKGRRGSEATDSNHLYAVSFIRDTVKL